MTSELGAERVEIRAATADRWDDLRVILGPRDLDTPSCWCLSMRVSQSDPRFKGLKGDRTALARARVAVSKELCSGATPPGILAYVDGEVAGWCSVSPRASYDRLATSRVIPHLDDAPVWSVVCLVVRAGWRRQGLAGHLLDGAVEFACSHAAAVVEGYPVDNRGERIDVASAYVGTRTLFERHGFAWASDTAAVGGGKPRVIMRRTL